MDTNNNIEERLWDYIDGISGMQEKNAIEKLLETNIQWQEKYNELLNVSTILKYNVETDEPSMRFTQNVMEEIAKYHIAPATSSYINKKLIYSIGSIFVVIIAAMLVYTLTNIKWQPSSGNAGLFDFSKLGNSKLFSPTSVNIFISLNAIALLMLFERYLSIRKKKLMEKNLADNV